MRLVVLGAIEAGKVWPGSSTWVSSGAHYVFCRDGVGAGTKIRVIYYSGGWKSAVVGEYLGFQGDQAQAQASGRLLYINANDGSLLSLGWRGGGTG